MKVGKFLTRTLDRFLGWQSLVGDKPVFDPTQFDYVPLLEANWQAIRAELDGVLERRDKIPAFHELSPDQARISKGRDWKMFVLYGFGRWAQRNAAHCPETERVLRQIPGLRNAFFSILEPQYHIVPHRGVTKGVLRCHLALKVPQARENCWIRVHDQYLNWEEGRCMVFDDTFEHEVGNETDETRVVLFLDVDRPMRWPGRVVSNAFMRLVEWSAYVKDARRNLQAWEDRFESAVERAQGFNIDSGR